MSQATPIKQNRLDNYLARQRGAGVRNLTTSFGFVFGLAAPPIIESAESSEPPAKRRKSANSSHRDTGAISEHSHERPAPPQNDGLDGTSTESRTTSKRRGRAKGSKNVKSKKASKVSTVREVEMIEDISPEDVKPDDDTAIDKKPPAKGRSTVRRRPKGSRTVEEEKQQEGLPDNESTSCKPNVTSDDHGNGDLKKPKAVKAKKELVKSAKRKEVQKEVKEEHGEPAIAIDPPEESQGRRRADMEAAQSAAVMQRPRRQAATNAMSKVTQGFIEEEFPVEKKRRDPEPERTTRRGRKELGTIPGHGTTQPNVADPVLITEELPSNAHGKVPLKVAHDIEHDIAPSSEEHVESEPIEPVRRGRKKLAASNVEDRLFTEGAEQRTAKPSKMTRKKRTPIQKQAKDEPQAHAEPEGRPFAVSEEPQELAIDHEGEPKEGRNQFGRPSEADRPTRSANPSQREREINKVVDQREHSSSGQPHQLKHYASVVTAKKNMLKSQRRPLIDTDVNALRSVSPEKSRKDPKSFSASELAEVPQKEQASSGDGAISNKESSNVVQLRPSIEPAVNRSSDRKGGGIVGKKKPSAVSDGTANIALDSWDAQRHAKPEGRCFENGMSREADENVDWLFDTAPTRGKVKAKPLATAKRVTRQALTKMPDVDLDDLLDGIASMAQRPGRRK